jgi:hypothetical protein
MQMSWYANVLITLLSNSYAKTSIPRKSSKLDLIGVWYKDISTIGNEPLSNKYWFANKKYKNDPTKSVVFQ